MQNTGYSNQSGQNNRQPNGNQPTDWGREIGKSFGIAGKVIGKIFAYGLNVLLTIVLICLITGVIVGTAFAIWINQYVDPTIDLSLFPTGQNLTSTVVTMDWVDRSARIGTPKTTDSSAIFASQNSIWASFTDMPTYLYEAFISVEDKRFWDHKGVDWIGTLNATFEFVTGTGSRGGSTITQQLVKNITEDDDVTIQRKVQEILRALNLEKQKSKEEILELYLNIIYLSQNCTGVQAAAQTYFGKDVSELTLIECAALAAIPQYPTKYDPLLYPENNKERRDVILELMLDQGKITQAEFDGAHHHELVLNVTESVANDTVEINSWYKDALIDDVLAALQEELGISRQAANIMLYTGGLTIYSLEDPEVQSVLEEVYLNDDNFLRVSDGIQPESAMVIIDPYTGDILGLVGGRGEKTLNRGLNLATQSLRPPGSSIKPISVYAPALDAGLITYASVFDDVPVNFGSYTKVNSDGTYSGDYVAPKAWPSNLPAVYNGLTNINSAIERSVNTIAVRVLQKLTLQNSISFLRDKLHMENVVESYTSESGNIYSDCDYAPLALGQLTWGITVREITAAYSIFQNNGVYNETHTFWKVLDSAGNIILNNEIKSEIVISDQTACIMTKMMQNVMNNGTGKIVSLRNYVDVAGKTGTSSADYDRWFIGYTPYYVGGVWVGYEMPLSMEEFKSNPAAIIWDTVMTKLHQKYIDAAASGGETLKKFELAAGIVTATYCKDSGKLMTDACALDPRGSRAETGYFTRTTVPTEYCDCHVVVDYDTSTGGVCLPGCTCSEEDVKQVALIKVETRSFPTYVVVTDAQYVYRELPSTVRPAAWTNVPFFQNIIDEGEYIGTSFTTTGRPFNSFCVEHYNFNNFGNITVDTAKEDEKTEETKDDSIIILPPSTEDTGQTEPEPEETTATDEQTEETKPVQEETTASGGIIIITPSGGDETKETYENPWDFSSEETDEGLVIVFPEN